jgi:hypothetical protein
MSQKKYKVGLVLSGGGTRGFAHLGVIQALNEAGIYILMWFREPVPVLLPECYMLTGTHPGK